MRNTLPREVEDTSTHEERPLALTEQNTLSLWRRWASHEGALVAGLVVCGFLLRVGLLGFDSVITPDGVSYGILGWNFIEGNFTWAFSTYWPPLYPILIGVTSLLVGDIEMSGRVISLVAGSLVAAPSYVLMRDWYGRRVAALGALLVVVHPVLIYYSTLVLTESTYSLFFISGVLAGWRALARGRKRAFALAGLAFGACYLLKPEAFGYILLLLALTAGARLSGQRRALKDALLDSATLLSGFMLLALPYLLYLHRAMGKWTISAKLHGHLLQGVGRDGVAMQERALPGASVALVQLTKSLRSEYEVLNLIFPMLFVILVAIGLFRTRWTRERAHRELYLLLFVAATLAGYVVTLPNIRYLAPMLPLLMCWVAKGVYEAEGWFAETLEATTEAAPRRRSASRLRALFKPLMVVALVLSMTPVLVYLLKGDKWSDYYGQREAALWIKARSAPNSTPVIMSTVPIPAFYAKGRPTTLNLEEDYATLIEHARRERVDYIVVNERDIKDSRLNFLLDEARTPPELRLLYKFADAPGHKILVYALQDSPEKQSSPR